MENFAYLDSLLERFAKDTVAGCACIVTREGKKLYEGYHGYADLESSRPIEQDTVYRLFSLTKIAIYTACMMLYERGAFLLNDPLYEYIPEYRHMSKYVRTGEGKYDVRPVERPIEIKHIMSMSMGLPYGHTILPGDNEMAETSREMCRVTKELAAKGAYSLQEEVSNAAQVPLAFEPGTRWLYGFGSELAARLVEVVTGQNIETALRTLLLDPLGMTSTGMHFFGDIQSRMSTFYMRDADGTLSPGKAVFDDKHLPGREHESGCARLFTTAEDFSRLARMLACGGVYEGQRIMGKNTIELMRTNQLDKQQLADFHNPYLDGYGYGLGVRVMMDRAGGNSNSPVGEFGWTGGSGTWISMDPQDKVSVIYMHQMAPNMEVYHHLRVRAAVYGAIE